MPKQKEDKINFESALEELNDIVEQMEEGGLTLEKSLQQFERGITLTRQCQKELKDAEQKVQILVKQTDSNNQDNANLEPYQEEGETK